MIDSVVEVENFGHIEPSSVSLYLFDKDLTSILCTFDDEECDIFSGKVIESDRHIYAAMQRIFNEKCLQQCPNFSHLRRFVVTESPSGIHAIYVANENLELENFSLKLKYFSMHRLLGESGVPTSIRLKSSAVDKATAIFTFIQSRILKFSIPHVHCISLPHQLSDWSILRDKIVRLIERPVLSDNLISQGTHIFFILKTTNHPLLVLYFTRRRYDIPLKNEPTLLNEAIVAFIASSALEIEVLFDRPLQVVPVTELILPDAYVEFQTILSQRQCLCLLAHAFLDTMPAFPYEGFIGQRFSMALFASRDYDYPKVHEKLKCVMSYFSQCRRRVQADRRWMGSKIAIIRKKALVLPTLEDWCGSGIEAMSAAQSIKHSATGRDHTGTAGGIESSARSRVDDCGGEVGATDAATVSPTLCSFHVLDTGGIEECRHSIHADFANQLVGGGALNSGCVQVASVCSECS